MSEQHKKKKTSKYKPSHKAGPGEFDLVPGQMSIERGRNGVPDPTTSGIRGYDLEREERAEAETEERERRLKPRLYPSGKTVDELPGFQEIRICPWTTREIIRHPNAMRYPNSYKYRDTGKACPWRVAYAAGFRPPQPQTETHYA